MSQKSEQKRTRTIIVDDEEPARLILREFIQESPGLELVTECANGFEAVKAIGELAPDLIFLDVQMPKLDGFEVLALLESPPAVIFTTAYDEYALRAFEVHAADYLLKPFSQERFNEAVEHARALDRSRPPNLKKLAEAGPRAERPLERILVKDGSRVSVVPVENVDYVEAQDDYVAIYSGGKCLLKQQTLTDLASRLNRDEFVRIHRSYLLNIRRLARIELYAKDSRLAILESGKQLPVSRSGYVRLREHL